MADSVRLVGRSETGPKWVLGELSPVMSGYIRLAGNGLSNIPRSNAPRVARLHLRLPALLDGTGAPVAPPLASSLHPGFHCRRCLLALYCGRLGASETGEDVVATPGRR